MLLARVIKPISGRKGSENYAIFSCDGAKSEAKNEAESDAELTKTKKKRASRMSHKLYGRKLRFFDREISTDDSESQDLKIMER